MSRKHYVAAAKVINHAVSLAVLNEDSRSLELLAEVAEGLADTFADDNPRFDRARFYDAALGQNVRP